jgi:hypothetical protein
VQLLGYSKNCQTKNKQEQVSFTSSYVDWFWGPTSYWLWGVWLGFDS